MGTRQNTILHNKPCKNIIRNKKLRFRSSLVNVNHMTVLPIWCMYCSELAPPQIEFYLLIFWREFWNICGELVQETALKKAYYIHQAMLPWQTFNQLPWKHVNINIKRIKTRHTSSHISLQDMRNLTNHINLSNIINQMPTLILGQIFTWIASSHNLWMLE